MRKQESVHLHALLLEITNHLEGREETRPVDLSEYYARDIGPSSVHRAKDAHEEAIMVLARAIEASLDRSADPEPRMQ